jgi:hypothetical protein
MSSLSSAFAPVSPFSLPHVKLFPLNYVLFSQLAVYMCIDPQIDQYYFHDIF